MSRFRRSGVIDTSSLSSVYLPDTSIFATKIVTLPSFFEKELDYDFTLDLLSCHQTPFALRDTFDDLTQIEVLPFTSSYTRIQRRGGRSTLRLESHLGLDSLSDRVAALESGFDQLAKSSSTNSCDRKYTWAAEIKDGVDRKYTWTAEIKDGVDRKYKLTAEIKGEKEKKKTKKEKKEEGKGGVAVKNYKWTAEIKGRGNAGKSNRSGKKDKEKREKEDYETRYVEIEEAGDKGPTVLRQAFAKRAGAMEKVKGKRKELSPQDAAVLIQETFRTYLIRRSQALRALRELAVAKTKLKEIRALFHNFRYRRCIASDAAERQKFSEKIIVLLLTVDSIEGADLMVRSAKRSMVDELEAMLDAVDPQPAGRSLSLKRRTFDLPGGAIQKEIAAGVTQVVQMINQGDNDSDSVFEACL